MIEGRIQYASTDQAGVKKTACDIRCDNFVMLGRMEDGNRDSGSYGGKNSGGQDFEDHGAPSPAGGNNSFPDDDIPF